MRLLGNIKEIKGRLNTAPSKDVLQTTRNWFNDRYEWVQVQRNLLFILTLVCIVSIAVLAAGISFIKSSRTIEPFVIEIEPKTGVPTVVDPKTVDILSADDAVQKSGVWNYIKMREEYYYNSYSKMFNTIRLMSGDDVYYSYRQTSGPGNSQSAYSLLGQGGIRTVELKSMLIEANGARVNAAQSYTAQVRLRVNTESAGSGGGMADKYVRMEFEFRNLEMSEEERLLNPLGFFVTQYQITDDKVL